MKLSDVERFIERHHLLAPGERVVVGVSGGVDSLVLLDSLHGLGYDVRAAHVNYRLRGDASDGDEQHVLAFCAEHGIPASVERTDAKAFAEKARLSVQEAARKIRYDFFRRYAAVVNAEVIATGHHLDDQAETVLLNLFRGAGLRGLAGIPVKRSAGPAGRLMVVRPLLFARRADIEAFARERGTAWRTDAGNRNVKYRRSALRMDILPEIERHFGAGVAEHIARAAELIRDHLDQEDAVSEGSNRLHLTDLQQASPARRRHLVHRALRRELPEAPLSYAFVMEVLALVDAQVGRRIETPGGAIWRERDALLFLPSPIADAGASPEQAFLHGEGETEIPEGRLQLSLLPERPDPLDCGTPDVVYVDADRLVFPLVLRPWRPGDRMRPLGMKGAKKVSDVLTDAGIVGHARGRAPVLLSGERVVWVVGVRLAEEARIRPDSRRFAKIAFIRSR